MMSSLRVVFMKSCLSLFSCSISREAHMPLIILVNMPWWVASTVPAGGSANETDF